MNTRLFFLLLGAASIVLSISCGDGSDPNLAKSACLFDSDAAVPYDFGNVNISGAIGSKFACSVRYENTDLPTEYRDAGFSMSAVPIHGLGYNLEGGGEEITELVIIMHGWHFFARLDDAPRSYRGYDYLATNLVKPGRAVVSIDGDFLNGTYKNSLGGETGVKSNNFIRGFLILSHLDALFGKHPGITKVALIGHSRGGEGAIAAWMILNDPNLRKLFRDSGFLTNLIKVQNKDLLVGIKTIIGIAPAEAMKSEEFTGKYNANFVCDHVCGDGTTFTSNDNFNCSNGKPMIGLLPACTLKGGIKCKPGTTIYKFENAMLNNVDYFTLQGSHDGDTIDFQGMRFYDRALKSVLDFNQVHGEKAMLFIHGGNHSYFNKIWAEDWDNASNTTVKSNLEKVVDGYNVSHDNKDGFYDGYIFSGNPNNYKGYRIQQEIAAKYISSFINLSFYGSAEDRKIMAGKTKPEYQPLNGDMTFKTDCEKVVTRHQYQSADRVLINHFEDGESVNTSIPGGKNYHSTENLFFGTKVRSVKNTWTDLGAVEPGDTKILELSWSQPDKYSYWIELGQAAAGIQPFNAVSFRAGLSVNSPLNKYGEDKSIVVRLNGTKLTTVVLKPSMKVTAQDNLPVDISKTMMETYFIPLNDLGPNETSDSRNVNKIELLLTPSSGMVIIDDIQFTNIP